MYPIYTYKIIYKTKNTTVYWYHTTVNNHLTCKQKYKQLDACWNYFI